MVDINTVANVVPKKQSHMSLTYNNVVVNVTVVIHANVVLLKTDMDPPKSAIQLELDRPTPPGMFKLLARIMLLPIHPAAMVTRNQETALRGANTASKNGSCHTNILKNI